MSNDLLSEVIKHCSLETLLSMSLVCKQWLSCTTNYTFALKSTYSDELHLDGLAYRFNLQNGKAKNRFPFIKKIEWGISSLDNIKYWKDTLTCIHVTVDNLDTSIVFPHVVEMHLRYTDFESETVKNNFPNVNYQNEFSYIFFSQVEKIICNKSILSQNALENRF